MAKDPAFLFYPGDYLKDTQCLSENSQVAYDRIMCEHMRDICITESRLKFLSKKLDADEKEELMSVLKKISGGYCIEWVADSVSKRKSYTESRRSNRLNKNKNIPESYDNHMEDVNVNVNVNDTVTDKSKAEETISGKPKRKKKVGLTDEEKKLDFYHLTSPEFKQSWNELILTDKWKKKMLLALQMSLDKLKKYPVEFCIQLIKDSIEGNWQGVVFDDTPEKFIKWSRSNDKKITKDESEFAKDFRGN